MEQLTIQSAIRIAPEAEYDGQEPFAEAFMAAEGADPLVRYARAHCASWQLSPISIGEDELIVGIRRPHRVVDSSIIGLLYDEQLCRQLLETGDDATRERMRRISAYFPGRHVTADLIHDEAVRRNAFWHLAVGNGASYQGHLVVDYPKILRLGIAGLRAEIIAAQQAHGDGAAFYQALLLYCENMAVLCRRYAQAADEQASQASPARAGTLREIANRCRRLADHPPATLHDAMQLYWFIFLLDGNDSVGRLDQYLFPYYQADIQHGRLVPAAAKTLLTHLWRKMGQVMAWSVVLGGVTPNGIDGFNALSALCLEVTTELHQANPTVSLRLSSSTPREVWRQAMRCLATGSGMPALVNDDAVIPALLEMGVQLADARDYAMGGCIEFQIAGRSNFGGEDGQINLAKCLELALHNGRCQLTGTQIGCASGDPEHFASYEDVWQAYCQQVEYALEHIIVQCNVGQEIKHRQGTKLFRSLLIDDCVANAHDCEGGGARYGHGQLLTNGIIVVADSLAVLRYLVFGNGSIPWPQLLAALRANWHGFETLRQRIATEAPRFGNDDPRVDGIARQVAAQCWTRLREYRTYRNNEPYTGLVVYFTRQHYFGVQTAATPDGRADREVLEDSIGPWPGRDRRGLTAVLSSAATIDQRQATGGVIFNLKLSSNMLHGDTVEKIIDVIQGYFRMNGQQVQLTVTSADDLRQAIEHPELWQHLLVRVGGFCAQFVGLEVPLQESILQRTEYGG